MPPDSVRTGKVLGRNRTSTLLRELAEAEGDPEIAVGEIVAALRNRALGLLLVVFGTPSVLPAPPPLPAICGAAVIVVAVNMIVGRSPIWLPRFIARRSLSRATLRRLIQRILPAATRLEKVCRPRLFFMTERPARVAIGVVMFVLGFIMVLPIPVVGNIPPAIAIVVTGFGISERDGAAVIAGLSLSAVALVVTSTAAWAALTALAWAI